MYRQRTANLLDEIENTLLRGIAHHLSDTGFSQCHLGLSGGLDSALVAYLAVKAVGKENVCCLILPSRFTPQSSLDHAVELAGNLGCRYEMISIEPVYAEFLRTMSSLFANIPADTAEENIQSRIRGTILMAYSNKFHSMLFATGNKSELSMGYCTLYGDMNGGLSPIGDLYKMDVSALCSRINENSLRAFGKPVIPEAIITKPPSAELRPNQTDQDTLPPYDLLDTVLRDYFSESKPGEIADRHNLDRTFVERIIHTVQSMEFKRRQAPPVLPLRSILCEHSAGLSASGKSASCQSASG